MQVSSLNLILISLTSFSKKWCAGIHCIIQSAEHNIPCKDLSDLHEHQCALHFYDTESYQKILDVRFPNLQGNIDFISCQHDMKINYQILAYVIVQNLFDFYGYRITHSRNTKKTWHVVFPWKAKKIQSKVARTREKEKICSRVFRLTNSSTRCLQLLEIWNYEWLKIRIAYPALCEKKTIS